MASTKQKDNNPLLTSRAALTMPSGALFRIRGFHERVRFNRQFREGW
jgi:hypothetical protein